MSPAYPEPPCPFCAIASNYPPRSPSNISAAHGAETATEAGNGGQAHLVLSTKHVLAFLDIMPLTRGHLLVTSREHYKTLAEVDVQLGMEVILRLLLFCYLLLLALYEICRELILR